MCKIEEAKNVLIINGKSRAIDSCIFSFVKLLNKYYKTTIACCCGHGYQPASIVFDDNTEMRIMTFEQAREVDKLFPAIDGRIIK